MRALAVVMAVAMTVMPVAAKDAVLTEGNTTVTISPYGLSDDQLRIYEVNGFLDYPIKVYAGDWNSCSWYMDTEEVYTKFWVYLPDASYLKKDSGEWFHYDSAEVRAALASADMDYAFLWDIWGRGYFDSGAEPSFDAGQFEIYSLMPIAAFSVDENFDDASNIVYVTTKEDLDKWAAAGLITVTPFSADTAAQQPVVTEQPSETQQPASEESSVTEQAIPATTYVTKKGDNLCKIAQSCYGDPKGWRAIYEANKDTIKVVNGNYIIYANQTLMVPAR